MVLTILIVVGVLVSLASIRYWVKNVATTVAREVATKIVEDKLDDC
jgi:hypothetical protein